MISPLLPQSSMFNPLEDDSYTCEHCGIKIPHSYLDGGPHPVPTKHGEISVCFSCYEVFMDGIGELKK